MDIESLRVPLSATYRALKRDELAWLSEFSKTPFSNRSFSHWTYSDLLLFKIKVRENMHHIDRGFLGESDIAGVTHSKISHFDFSYVYQRAQLRFDPPLPLKILNPGLDINFSFQKGFLLSSCQGGLTQLFFSIEKIFGRLPVYTPYHCYYETKLFFGRFYWSLHSRQPRGPHILLIDSSTMAKSDGFSQLKIDSRNCQLIVVDTTCFPFRSEAFLNLMKLLKRSGVPIVLARSSIKLDSIGIEFGRFGHVLLLASKKTGRFAKLVDDYDGLMKLFGSSASSRQLYPFYHDPRFHRLSIKWIERIQDSNKILSEEMMEVFGPIEMAKRFVEFKHQFFHWIFIGNRPEEHNRISQRLREGLIFQRVPFIMAASFPWDTISLTSFSDQSRSKTERRYLRIACGDFDPESARIYAKKLAVTLKGLL